MVRVHQVSTSFTQEGRVSYRDLARFFWKFMRPQRWTFFSILIQDCINCFDALLWPFLLRWVIDIFARYDTSRALAWNSLRTPLFLGVAFLIFIEINSRVMGFLMARAIPKLQAEVHIALFDPIHFAPSKSGLRSLTNKIRGMTTQMESILQPLFWPLISSVEMSVMGALFL